MRRTARLKPGLARSGRRSTTPFGQFPGSGTGKQRQAADKVRVRRLRAASRHPAAAKISASADIYRVSMLPSYIARISMPISWMKGWSCGLHLV
jgi:hypothetical protein